MEKLLKKFREELHIVDLHFTQFASSLWVIATGVALFYDRNYFFYPPSLASVENDQRIDIAIIILGIGLLICTLTNNRSMGWTYFFLILCGGVALTVAGVQLIHVHYAAQIKMMLPTIGNVVLFFLLVRAAYKA